MIQRLLNLPIVFGICLISFGLYKGKVSKIAYPVPHNISCDDLAVHGPGENAHIILYEHKLCDEGFAYLQSEEMRSWMRVWIPAVPVSSAASGNGLNSDAPCSGAQVIIESRRVRNERDLERLYARPTIQGIVLNAVDPLGPLEQEELQEIYPDIDFDTCWLVVEGEQPANPQTARNFIWFGGMLIGLCVVIKIGIAWYE